MELFPFSIVLPGRTVREASLDRLAVGSPMWSYDFGVT